MVIHVILLPLDLKTRTQSQSALAGQSLTSSAGSSELLPKEQLVSTPEVCCCMACMNILTSTANFRRAHSIHFPAGMLQRGGKTPHLRTLYSPMSISSSSSRSIDIKDGPCEVSELCSTLRCGTTPSHRSLRCLQTTPEAPQKVPQDTWAHHWSCTN